MSESSFHKRVPGRGLGEPATSLHAVGQSRPTMRHHGRLLWPETIITPHPLQQQVGKLAAAGLAQLRTNRPLQAGILATVVAWVVLQLAFVAWVHFNLEGVAHRAFLPGTIFGVPEREAKIGLSGVCKIGADGQQYYWISNDLFGNRDAYKHLDQPLYRYQRIGMPLLAGGLAGLLGYELTPPMLYLTLQFAITCIGFGTLVYWLMIHQVPWYYALGWLLSVATLGSLWLGLLDSSGDTLLVFVLLAMFSRRLWVYMPIATILLLTREMYCVFAGFVFLASVCNWVDWKDVSKYWQRLVLTAIPGAAMLAWTAYLTIHFQMSPLAARGAPGLKSWPFAMIGKFTKMYYREGNWFDLKMVLLTAASLVLVMVLLARNWRRVPVALVCMMPYLLLTASLGSDTWEHYASHTRCTSATLIVGMMLLPFDGSLILRLMLVLQAIVGVDLQFGTRFIQSRLISPYVVNEEAGWEPIPPGAPDNGLLSSLDCQVEWTNSQKILRHKYHGVWDSVHRELLPVTVAVTNNTDVTWHPGKGRHPIWLGYRLFDGGGKRMFVHRSVIIDKAIAPGETQEITTYLELRKPNKNYLVEFSLWQEGPGWFVDRDAEFGRRYEFRVE